MKHNQARRWQIAFLIALIAILAPNIFAKAAARNSRETYRAPRNARSNSLPAKAASRNAASCSPCAVGVVAKGRKLSAGRRARPASCRLKGQVNPRIAGNYNRALKEIRQAGYSPGITSTWRSPQEQARLYKCTRNQRCRRANPGLYRAQRPGASLHEAGLAVDVSGIATGPRGAKRLTPRGRRIVKIMRKNGFSWRYGLADPAHFEADPRRAGYRNLNHAIKRSKPRCSARIASNGKASRRRLNN